MGAAAPLKSTFETGVFNVIASFCEHCSDVAICGTDTTDIANIADLDDCTANHMTTVESVEPYRPLYMESWPASKQCYVAY